MDDRKDYVAPAIEWEDVLEQTSLACNAIQGDIVGPACFAGDGTGTFTQGCGTDVAKGGAFIDEDRYCSTYFDWPEGIVVLS
ncbi:MAG: hypothetical protein JSV81_22815 [Anaerolineales bacterium]|nr:MAG: hypothetical protein JSV81_22815 [Anaerolineales bacterium]